MIVLEAVTKLFGEVWAVREVSFEVAAGESVALVGPSGSGKSTLLRLIAGLEVPDGGRIWLDGKVVGARGWSASPHRRCLGMVFQRPALWPHLTVLQNIRFGLGGLPRPEVEKRLRETIGLTCLEGLEGRYPDQLSGGEAQRAALARALAPKPSLLLLDEPLANLDPELGQKMIDLILQARIETGTTMLYVTHDPIEASALTDRTIRLRRGRVDGIEKLGATDRPEEGR